MIFKNSKYFLENVSRNGRLLGVDFGTKRIGLSISDLLWSIAIPLTIITSNNCKQDILALNKLVVCQKIKGLIIGSEICKGVFRMAPNFICHSFVESHAFCWDRI